MHRIEGDNVDASSGVNQFSSSAPYTVITPEWCNAIQEELMTVVENSGLATLIQANDTKNQLWAALQAAIQNYDHVVYSPQTFSDAIERVAANQYKIKDDYKSVLFKPYTGGYSYLNYISDGDTWGYIETNNCTNLEFINGAFISMGDTQGYIEVNTSGCLLKNVDIRGIGSVASAITKSFLLNAGYVTYDNCKTSLRLSNAIFKGFIGDSTDIGENVNNYTSKYINCSVYDVSSGSSTTIGFQYCHNLTNCIVYDIDDSSTIYGFYDCRNINSCYAVGLISDSSVISGFYRCYQVSSCMAKNLDTSSGVGSCYGFNECMQISACKSETLDADSGNVQAFGGCDQISGCYVTDIDAGSGNAFGFASCEQISACKANDVDSSSGSAYGFYGCDYGSSLYTTETCSNNTFINADTNEYSCPTGLTP